MTQHKTTMTRTPRLLSLIAAAGLLLAVAPRAEAAMAVQSHGAAGSAAGAVIQVRGHGGVGGGGGIGGGGIGGGAGPGFGAVHGSPMAGAPMHAPMPGGTFQGHPIGSMPMRGNIARNGMVPMGPMHGHHHHHHHHHGFGFGFFYGPGFYPDYYYDDAYYYPGVCPLTYTPYGLRRICGVHRYYYGHHYRHRYGHHWRHHTVHHRRHHHH